MNEALEHVVSVIEPTKGRPRQERIVQSGSSGLLSLAPCCCRVGLNRIDLHYHFAEKHNATRYVELVTADQFHARRRTDSRTGSNALSVMIR